MFDDRRTRICSILETTGRSPSEIGPAVLRIFAKKIVYLKFLRLTDGEQSIFLAAVATLSRLSYRELCLLDRIVERVKIGELDYIRLSMGPLTLTLWVHGAAHEADITSFHFDFGYDGPDGDEAKLVKRFLGKSRSRFSAFRIFTSGPLTKL